MPKILVINGPNLNLLGDRETQHYGRETLPQIDQRLVELGKKSGVTVSTFQSNAEAPLIERIHAAKSDETAYIIINPAAFTHTSVALRDALAAVRSRSSRCTCPTSTRANPSASTPISRTWRPE